MATIKHTLPASLRADSLVDSKSARENSSAMGPDRRPYLVTPANRKAASSTRHQLALFPHESEDARLTGATRSLYRRLLALNLPRTEPRIEVSSQLPHKIVDVRTALPGARIA